MLQQQIQQAQAQLQQMQIMQPAAPEGYVSIPEYAPAMYPGFQPAPAPLLAL